MSGGPELWRRSATDLAAMLDRGEVTSVELTRSHLARIDALNGRLLALMEVLRGPALADAELMDQERRRGEVRGPLHGMPLTVKESLAFRGRSSTLGLKSRVGEVAAKDAVLVRMAREAGAVILGRSNIPQTLLSFECRNPLFGQTANAFSLAHSPGGSSGGEAAALSAGLSPLGLGTDIGGSIRIPAHCSGVVGFKPSLDRWSNQGLGTILAGQEGVRVQSGAMARSVADLLLLLRGLDPRRMSELDGRVSPLPWGEPADLELAGLRIGYYVDDGVIPASRSLVRAVERAAEVLRDRGAELVPFTPPGIPDAIGTYFAAVSADGGATFAAALRGEPVDVGLRSLNNLARLPNAARAALARVMDLRGERRLALVLRSVRKHTVDEYWRLIARLRAYRGQVLDALARAGVSVLLAPPFATAAVPHGLSADFALAASYTMLYNLLQFPAGVVPVSRVRPGENVGRALADRFDRRAAEVDAASTGLPVGVQVIGRPWADETVLAVMAAVEEGVGGDDGFPRTPVDLPAG